MINYGKKLVEKYTSILTTEDLELHETNKFLRSFKLKQNLD